MANLEERVIVLEAQAEAQTRAIDGLRQEIADLRVDLRTSVVALRGELGAIDIALRSDLIAFSTDSHRRTIAPSHPRTVAPWYRSDCQFTGTSRFNSSSQFCTTMRLGAGRAPDDAVASFLMNRNRCPSAVTSYLRVPETAKRARRTASSGCRR